MFTSALYIYEAKEHYCGVGEGYPSQVSSFLLMDCHKCNSKNGIESKFCRSCGTKLHLPSTKLTITIPSISIPNLGRFIGVFRRRKKNAIIFASIFSALLVTGTALAAPKIGDYVEVNRLVAEAMAQETAGEYQSALDTLTLADDKWTLESKRVEIDKLKESQSKYIQFKAQFDAGLELEKKGKLVEARTRLQSIGTDFPHYADVREKLDNIQTVIEGNLENTARAKEREAQRATAAAAEARQQAETESAAKAAAEARSIESAQAARNAEAQRQQEAAQRAEEVKKSFVNQLYTGYSSYISGSSYYSSAISYSNSSNSLLALSQANSARAVLNTARNSVDDLNSRFTGLSSDYYTAANNMVNAVDYLNKAIDLLVSSEGTSLDYSSSINSYKNLSVAYAAKVKVFLDSH